MCSSKIIIMVSWSTEAVDVPDIAVLLRMQADRLKMQMIEVLWRSAKNMMDN